LAENYLYTREAIDAMYDRLADEGIMSIGLYATLGPLRYLVNTSLALEARGRTSLQDSVVCLSTDNGLTTVVLLKKGVFSAKELATIDRFTEEIGIPLVYHPRRTLNKLIEQFLRCTDRAQFIEAFPLNITPTSDDRPYFHNFMKGMGLTESKLFLRDPPAMHGNPFFIVIQLLLSTVFAVILIFVPVLVTQRKELKRRYLKRFLLFFICLGVGFIAIEISLMQKLVLFLGHPLYSVTVTLFSMLVFAGIGSLISERWLQSSTPRALLVPAALAVSLVLFVVLSPKAVVAWVGWPTWGRILIATAMLAPVSLLLGMPFAYGIRLVNHSNPTIIPWAWAVNGCMTVVGSILTVILSMNYGFNVVLIGAIVVYVAAFLAVRRTTA
jgi:hypothetical protein